ncbi:hypothetical protein D3C71_1181400 [compost metagenome]
MYWSMSDKVHTIPLLSPHRLFTIPIGKDVIQRVIPYVRVFHTTVYKRSTVRDLRVVLPSELPKLTSITWRPVTKKIKI